MPLYSDLFSAKQNLRADDMYLRMPYILLVCQDISQHLSKYFNLTLFNFLHYIYLHFLLNLSAAEYFFSDGLKVLSLRFFLFSVLLYRLIEIFHGASDMMLNFQKYTSNFFQTHLCPFRECNTVLCLSLWLFIQILALI